MIKASATDSRTGRKVLILGLSRANCSRLLIGEPIQFSAAPYGFDMDIMICAGPTEAALTRDLLGSTDDPRIRIDPTPDDAA